MSEQKMPLTPEMRQNYIDVIHKIWPRVMDRYNANDVTDEVVDMMDTILNSIAECQKQWKSLRRSMMNFTCLLK